MSDINNGDCNEMIQLKECYELAMQYEKLDIVRDVLREKAKKINIPENYVSMQEGLNYHESNMQIISDALYELSLEGLTASVNQEFDHLHKINNLPSSAEKEYFLTLLALRNGTNETQRLEAVNHIRIALKYEPDDPRYLTLFSILQEADK